MPQVHRGDVGGFSLVHIWALSLLCPVRSLMMITYFHLSNRWQSFFVDLCRIIAFIAVAFSSCETELSGWILVAPIKLCLFISLLISRDTAVCWNPLQILSPFFTEVVECPGHGWQLWQTKCLQEWQSICQNDHLIATLWWFLNSLYSLLYCFHLSSVFCTVLACWFIDCLWPAWNTPALPSLIAA